MVFRLSLIAALIVLISVSSPDAAQSPGAPGMTIRADRMEHTSEDGVLHASGNVEVLWQDTTMFADKASYNSASKILTASGHIRIIKAGDTVSGDTLTLDTESGRAELENGHISMSKANLKTAPQTRNNGTTVRADAKKIIRTSEEDYTLQQGAFTTCIAEVPSWKLGASALDVTLDEYATGKHVVFYIKDVPVFYFPYLIYPVKRERQSGFLLPSLGSSSKRGTFVEIPYYWAISPSQEATITLDAQTKRGLGTNVDYRYLRDRGSEGHLGGYLINDNVTDQVRGQFSLLHFEQFENRLSFATNINLTSDRLFLADYGEKSGDYNRQYNESRIIIQKMWQQWMGGAQVIYTQDYTTNGSTQQVAPELFLAGIREPLAGLRRTYADISMQADNFYRKQGLYGQRLIMTPQLVNTNSFWLDRLNLSLSAGAQVRVYNAGGSQTSSPQDDIVVIPVAEASISSSLNRTFDVTLLDIQRIRHELVPSITYYYTGNIDQSNLPLFDQADRLNPRNQLAFSVANHFGSKLVKEGNTEYRDLMILRLTQPYNLTYTNQPDPLSLVSSEGNWGDLIVENELWAHKYVKILSDIRYSHQEQTISSSATGVELNDLRGNNARVSYRNVRQELEYMETGVAVALTSPFYLGYTNRYSFDKKDSLESYYTLEYRHQCWSVIAGYRERNNDKSWTINFNLGGLFNSGKRK